MPQTFQQKIERVKQEAQEPYKARIMLHHLKRVMEGVKTPKEQETFKEKSKEENKILSEGIEAVGSLAEIGYAVSTPRRFGDWARHNDLMHETDVFVDRKSWNKKEPITRNGKTFVPYEEFRQTGYGAFHIGSAIKGIQSQGREALILDAPRNRRFLYKETKLSDLEKIIAK